MNKVLEFKIKMNISVVHNLLKGGTYSPGTGRIAGADDKYSNTRLGIEKNLGHTGMPIYGYLCESYDAATEMFGESVVTVLVPLERCTITMGDSWGRGVHIPEVTKRLNWLLQNSSEDVVTEDRVWDIYNKAVRHTGALNEEFDWEYMNTYEFDHWHFPYMEVQYDGIIRKEDIVSIDLDVENPDGFTLSKARSTYEKAFEVFHKECKEEAAAANIPCSEFYEKGWDYSYRGIQRWGQFYDEIIEKHNLITEKEPLEYEEEDIITVQIKVVDDVEIIDFLEEVLGGEK